MVTSAASRLDRFSNDNYDFTYSNMVVITLIEIASYPINLEHTECMVIFNDQCYDFEYFVVIK